MLSYHAVPCALIHCAKQALWSANTFPSLSTNSNLIVYVVVSRDQPDLLGTVAHFTHAHTSMAHRYAMLAVGNSILHLAITAAVIFMVLQANLALHDSLLRGVLRSAQRFFDTTPAGRILNRFSKDLSTIDTGIQESLGYCLVRLQRLPTRLCAHAHMLCVCVCVCV